jgi:hypothetical protein
MPAPFSPPATHPTKAITSSALIAAIINMCSMGHRLLPLRVNSAILIPKALALQLLPIASSWRWESLRPVSA